MAAAERRAAQRRAAGAYADDLSGFEVQAGEAVTPELLRDWAVVRYDPAGVYSTRRLGAPVTALKRALLWLLRPYHERMLADQNRFNLLAARYVAELEERLRALERR